MSDGTWAHLRYFIGRAWPLDGRGPLHKRLGSAAVRRGLRTQAWGCVSHFQNQDQYIEHDGIQIHQSPDCLDRLFFSLDLEIPSQ